jgi:hypothetical protein
MNLTWRIETHAPYGRLIAVLSDDGDGISARIEGEFVDAPRAGDSDLPDRILRHKQYGPVTMHAVSLEALKRFVEEKIENDIGPVNKWTAETG